MDKLDTQVMPVPPNMITSLRAGFDAIANRIVIITIPIILDLFLWLGPHLQVKTLLTNYVNAVAATATATPSGQQGNIISTMVETMNTIASQFNLFSLLRTFPVGIPSLMATKSPIEIPMGIPVIFDVTNPIGVVLIIFAFLGVGLVLGSFYYLLVAQVSFNHKIEIKKILQNWLWAAFQVISLGVALIILFLIVSIPSSCIISSIAIYGLPLGQLAVFIYLGIILWLAFPLLFSAHGIFVNHNNVLVSVQRSVAMTRMTLPTTSLFLLCIFAISEGLDILWRVPPDKSWLTLIGVGGHAFVTSALLASSFIYYRDADIWSQGMLKQLKSKRTAIINGGNFGGSSGRQ